MPSLGMVTINALTAADSVIIPVQAQYLPAKGMTQLMRSIQMVRTHTNEKLKIGGIVMTLVDGRTNLAKDVINTIRTNYGMKLRIFDAQIPVAVKAAEAAKEGKSVISYDAGSRPAAAYNRFQHGHRVHTVHSAGMASPKEQRLEDHGRTVLHLLRRCPGHRVAEALERLLSIFMEGLKNGTVQMGESIRIEVLDWYVSQPMFIQRICAQQLNDAGILTEDHMCDKLSMSA